MAIFLLEATFYPIEVTMNDSVKQYLIPLVSPLLTAAVLVGFYEFKLKPVPAPDAAVVAVAKEYYRTLPGAYTAAQNDVLSGKSADKDAVLSSLRSHAEPLAKALDTATATDFDSNGKIVNQAHLADTLGQVAKAFGSK